MARSDGGVGVGVAVGAGVAVGVCVDVGVAVGRAIGAGVATVIGMGVMSNPASRRILCRSFSFTPYPTIISAVLRIVVRQFFAASNRSSNAAPILLTPSSPIPTP